LRLDLHVHSAASDGALAPEAVVRAAARGGLDVIALTDHDTTAGYAAALAAGLELDVQVVPALEVSSTYRDQEVHVLGYFVDPDAPVLRAHAEHARDRREARMREMLARLALRGIRVGYGEVVEAAGGGRAVIGRPHLAKALVARGLASSVEDAFDRLIGDESDAFVPTQLLGPAEAVGVVLEAGGIPVWAHPPGELLDELLPVLVQAGLRGLEVYRPKHQRTDVLRLEEICRRRGLLASGGSDWHRPEGGTSLGDFFVTADEVEALLAEGGI
jgi:predicted metal-dependent phosphoesterase TrpH